VRGADRRELPLVVVLAALLLADGLTSEGGSRSPLAIATVALVTVPLLWRRQAPQLVLVAIVAGVFVCLGAFAPYDVIAFPIIASAYFVAVAGDRMRSAFTAAFVIAAAIGGVLLYLDEGASWQDALLNCTLLLLAVATGDAVRARRAFRIATLARRAEQERERRAASLRMVAEERLRIAQEVHDVVAHAMVSINVQAGVAEHLLDQRPEQARTALADIKATSGAALEDLRGTLGLLRGDDGRAPIRPTGQLDALDELTGPLRAAGIDVDLTVTGRGDRVSRPISQAVYRIVQEASTNVMRHAAAGHVSVTVDIGAHEVDVVIEDDGGPGKPLPRGVRVGSGNGVHGMTERAISLGGRLDAGPGSTGGWRVHAVLPM
jgi:signal transduction histidine kinase